MWVRFTPTQVGLRTADVMIRSDDVLWDTLRLRLSGNGKP